MSEEQLYRPGLEGIIAGETSISSIQGGLYYRGYAVEDLARQATFEEVAYLLLYGNLPTADELKAFSGRLSSDAPVSTKVIDMLRHIPGNAPLMDVLRSGASYLAHWDPDSGDESREANLRKAERLLARLPVILAARHRMRQGKEPVPPDKHRSLAENLLWMITRIEPNEQTIRAMDVSLILYAEHEFNASTFTARVVCSTMSDMYSAITAAIGALKGPLHGGANERVMDVLQEVGTADKAEAWIRTALAEKRRIMGFGHRVYKDGDPRAAFLKPMCADLAEKSGNQEMEAMADTIERIVREEKKLPPNLDWPSARLYHYLGLAVDLYTPLFVVARTAGWAAHVIEQLGNNRLIRPVSRYTGEAPREWVSIAQRG
ncbi:MAG: citrate/2-methylcitrate synthase [Planctomycetota bacterium]|nr:citrate/2-methylcitrate synthase [Planctomycetota bacterium]